MSEGERTMMDASNNSSVPDAMTGRCETLEAQFLQYADAHREHYRALLDLSAKVRESLETLNQEREALFRGLRARAEALDDAGREIFAPHEL
jgi:hypothetical protein